MKLIGRVERARVGGASKSARLAVTLEVGDERYVLRRVGAPAFDDAVLEALVGQTITAEGEIAATTFLVERWTILSSDRGAKSTTKEAAPRRRPPRT